MTSQGFFVLSHCQPQVQLLSVLLWHLWPHGEEGRGSRTHPQLLSQPSPASPRGSSPSCLSLTSSELCWPQAFVPQCPSPDQRGTVPTCYTWCPNKSFGLYIYIYIFCWIVCTFLGVSVRFVVYFFFFLSDTCKVVFLYIYICENKVRIQS